MAATFFFVGCLLAPAQAPPGAAPAAILTSRNRDWAVAPRLSQAQELLYRGTYTEESRGSGVHFTRSYRVETRLLVLGSSPRGTEVALMTVLKPKEHRAGQESGPGAVRLEKALVETNGRLVAEPGHSLSIALDGPPTCECGMVVEIPGGRLALGQGWETLEPGRPARLWRAVGAEMVNGSGCLKLVASQRSEDWDQPRLDRVGWRREDTVWIGQRTGSALRVERVVERREVGRNEPSLRGVLRYELESSLQYPGQLFEDRKQETAQAWALAQAAVPLLSAPTRHGPELNGLLTRINYHLDKLTPTPYREALLQVKRLVEAGRRGETPVAAPGTASAAPVAEVGELAPDFVASYLTQAGPSFQLHRWLGRPLVLVFYNPGSPTSPGILGLAQSLAIEQGPRAIVLGLAVAGEPEKIRKQWSELHLTIPVLSGGGLHHSYAVDTTPKIVILDSNGVVRGTFIGWGSETAREVQAELRQWLPRKTP